MAYKYNHSTILFIKIIYAEIQQSYAKKPS